MSIIITGIMVITVFLLASALRGILAQRLLRTLCPSCREPLAANAEQVARLGLDKLSGDDRPQLFHAVGCADCGGSGYSGRTCVAELLMVSAGIRAAILDNSDAAGIARLAMSEGMVSMREHGLSKAMGGETTIEEVLRVTQET